MWLNEGFATLFQYYGLQVAYDKALIWQQFYLEEMRLTMWFDTSKITVKRANSIKTGKDIDFNSVNYGRGACMLMMLRFNIQYQ